MTIMKRLKSPAGETPFPGDFPGEGLRAKEAAPAILWLFKAI